LHVEFSFVSYCRQDRIAEGDDEDEESQASQSQSQSKAAATKGSKDQASNKRGKDVKILEKQVERDDDDEDDDGEEFSDEEDEAVCAEPTKIGNALH
jgi:hypothetical protein